MVVTFQILMTPVSTVDKSAQRKGQRLTLIARHEDQRSHMLFDPIYMKRSEQANHRDQK